MYVFLSLPFFLDLFCSKTEGVGGPKNNCRDNQWHQPGQTAAKVERRWSRPDKHKPGFAGSSQI